MPRGPKGEKRPADVIGAAVMIGRIATGEVEDAHTEKNAAAAELGKLGGAKGGRARAAKLSKDERTAAARKAAAARWGHSAGKGSPNVTSKKPSTGVRKETIK
jgi:hypothetical protein